ncbi:hypothetical protein LTR12_016189 [Friedmanniomyces endolithicus]|nr:hypothetical protein LTR74_016622 [Friedmanniomyces endolithicus]KAK1809450.1 hypothetical protein LTR12_016189 [Friedmanniomyces endolithicus]
MSYTWGPSEEYDDGETEQKPTSPTPPATRTTQQTNLTPLPQQPSTLGPTRAAIAQHAADLDKEIAWSQEARGRAKKADLEGEEGRDGVEIAGLLCERCQGTKLLWSDCGECERVKAKKVDAERVKAERVEAEKVEGEKVKAEKLAKGKRVEKAAGDDMATAGSGASPES